MLPHTAVRQETQRASVIGWPSRYRNPSTYRPIVGKQICFGCDGTTGTLAAEPVLSSADLALPDSGSWAPATPMPCPEAVPPDMACVPGGAFLLGGHGVVVASVQLRPEPEQLVQVAPFAMDLEEVTVGQLYELRRDGLVIGAPMLHDPDPQSATHMCHYLEDDRSNDALPVNCIEHALASAACVAMGLRSFGRPAVEQPPGNRPNKGPGRPGWLTSRVGIVRSIVCGRQETPNEHTTQV